MPSTLQRAVSALCDFRLRLWRTAGFSGEVLSSIHFRRMGRHR
jgi:hypothetical protein